MLEGILVTAPSGFEVSTDGITFSNTITVGGAGTILDTPVYIRLKGTIPAGSYSGDVVVTSNSAATATIATVLSTVNQAVLIITAIDANKTYGTANPTLTASYNGFVNGDTQVSLTSLATVTTIADATSPVGTYPITASGAVASNYTFTYVPATLSVTPGALIITADNQSKIYGSVNPALTASYAGFVNGDTAASFTTLPTIITTAVTESPVGTYAITASGAVDPNYTISYVTGNLIVTTAPLNITADDKTRVYGAPNPILTTTYSGFVNGDTAASLTTPPTISTIADATSPVGVYAITVSGAADTNYSITYITGVLTVTSPADVNLSGLTVNNGVLSPAFSPNILSYNVTVGNNVTTETITPIADDPLATITINGIAVPNGSPYTISLVPGQNTVVINVVGEDGVTTKSYTLNITRASISIATLSNLTISKGILDPSFKSDITNYNTAVKYDVNSITVTPTATDPGATITVNGITVASNTVSAPINLVVGENSIETLVTAADGITKQTYTIVVYKGTSPNEVVANNILSPNGDGKNDYWEIKDILLYPNNVVTVYDRAGRIVFSKKSYSNEWDGSYSGSPLNNDTYYYLIDLGDSLPKIKGFLTMIRD